MIEKKYESEHNAWKRWITHLILESGRWYAWWVSLVDNESIILFCDVNLGFGGYTGGGGKVRLEKEIGFESQQDDRSWNVIFCFSCSEFFFSLDLSISRSLDLSISLGMDNKLFEKVYSVLPNGALLAKNRQVSSKHFWKFLGKTQHEWIGYKRQIFLKVTPLQMSRIWFVFLACDER